MPTSTCDNCNGSGEGSVCWPCVTTGMTTCHYCGGSGESTSNRGSKTSCGPCYGKGEVKCWHCGGSGYGQCTSCNGSGITYSNSSGDESVSYSTRGRSITPSFPSGTLKLVTVTQWIAGLFVMFFFLYGINFFASQKTISVSSESNPPAPSVVDPERQERNQQGQRSRSDRVQNKEDVSTQILLWMTSGIRPEPSDDSPILVWIPEGTRLEWHSRIGEYYEVVYRNRIGYVKENLVEPKYRRLTNPLVTGPLNGAVVTRQSATLWARPSARARARARIPNGTVLRIFSMSGSYYQVFYGGQSGFLRKSETDPRYR